VVLGRFRIVRLLARGGMGEIYLARSEGAAGFAIPVVVKRVLSALSKTETVVDMFKREARIMSNLRHPGIVAVIDFGRDGDDYVMVLEYVHGVHAGRWSRWLFGRGDRFPVGRAVEIVLQMLSALQYAHTVVDADGQPLSVVHRDVSPSNVLIDVDGHVKLADFGVARMLGEHTEWRGGKAGDTTVKGKFAYLAPELLTSATPDAATDVYAAAVVLDELLRGLNAFRSEDQQVTIGRVIHLVPERLDRVRDDVPTALAFVVAKALSKTPSDRWGSAENFANALRRAWPTPQDQAQKELAAAARRDFHDPGLAKVFKIDPLATLERAWRDATGSHRHSAETIPQRLEEEDDELDVTHTHPLLRETQPAPADAGAAATPSTTTTPAGTGPSAPSGRVNLVLALGSLAIVAAATVGIVLALREPRNTPRDRPVYLVVDRGSDPTDAGSPALAAPDAQPVEVPSDLGLTVADAGASPTAIRPRAARASETANLEAPFRRRSTDIGRCFSANVADVASVAQLIVRFEVDVRGNVTNATVSPPEVARLPLGACILGVARSTQFGARSEPVSFRIPLGARRAPP
jgi:serine/threonine-protein kinase